MKITRVLTFFTATALAGASSLWAADRDRPSEEGAGKPPIRRDGDRPPGGPGDHGPGPRREVPPKFSDIDADQSGDISQEEWVSFHVKRAEQRAKEGFKFLDGNKDDKLVEAEMPKPRPDGDRPPGRPDGPRPPREGDRPGPRPEGDGQAPKRPPVE